MMFSLENNLNFLIKRKSETLSVKGIVVTVEIKVPRKIICSFMSMEIKTKIQ